MPRLYNGVLIYEDLSKELDAMLKAMAFYQGVDALLNNVGFNGAFATNFRTPLDNALTNEWSIDYTTGSVSYGTATIIGPKNGDFSLGTEYWTLIPDMQYDSTNHYVYIEWTGTTVSGAIEQEMPNPMRPVIIKVQMYYDNPNLVGGVASYLASKIVDTSEFSDENITLKIQLELETSGTNEYTPIVNIYMNNELIFQHNFGSTPTTVTPIKFWITNVSIYKYNLLELQLSEADTSTEFFDYTSASTLTSSDMIVKLGDGDVWYDITSQKGAVNFYELKKLILRLYGNPFSTNVPSSLLAMWKTKS